MKMKSFGMLLLMAFAPLFSNVVFAQDDFEEIPLSPIEELAYQEGTGEIRGFGQATSANAQLALNAAKAQATADLQVKIEQYVRYGLNQYMDETTVGDRSSLDDKTRNDVVTAATEHVTMTISELPCFEVLDKFPWNSSLTVSFCSLPLITKLEYEISEDFIEPKYIKFRRLEPLSNYDLSEIEYKGNIYLVMRNKE